MTREEAIEILCAYGVPQDEEEFQQALNMAIKALSQEPICPSHGIDCEDCPAYDPCGAKMESEEQA